MKILKRNKNYGVDEYGNVYSIKKNKKLTPKKNHDGYLRIQLWKNGKCEFVSIHRLVAEEYIPNPNNYPIVNHLDGDKQNNHYTNLEWCTQKDNIIHSWKNGFSKPRRNEKVKMSKRIDQLTLEGEYITTFPSTMEIERQLGIPHSQISNVCKNKKNYHSAGGFKWRYSETSND